MERNQRFWIPLRGFLISGLDSLFFCQWNLDFNLENAIVRGTPDSLSFIPDSKVHDSSFHKQNSLTWSDCYFKWFETLLMSFGCLVCLCWYRSLHANACTKNCTKVIWEITQIIYISYLKRRKFLRNFKWNWCFHHTYRKQPEIGSRHDGKMAVSSYHDQGSPWGFPINSNNRKIASARGTMEEGKGAPRALFFFLPSPHPPKKKGETRQLTSSAPRGL